MKSEKMIYACLATFQTYRKSSDSTLKSSFFSLIFIYFHLFFPLFLPMFSYFYIFLPIFSHSHLFSLILFPFPFSLSCLRTNILLFLFSVYLYIKFFKKNLIQACTRGTYSIFRPQVCHAQIKTQIKKKCSGLAQTIHKYRKKQATARGGATVTNC